jgi:hypothetical protein
MRTTIDIPEHLLVEAKRVGVERHLSFTKLVEESLRLYLGDLRNRPPDHPVAELPTLRQAKPLVSLDDTSSLLELE